MKIVCAFEPDDFFALDRVTRVMIDYSIIYNELAKLKIVEGHLMLDHIHICISIPPKYAVSNVVGYLKGKGAIAIARKFKGRQGNFNGESFGQGVNLYRRLACMNRWCVHIFEINKKPFEGVT